MIEYLEKLIAEKDYRKALEVAERMLGEGRREPRELLVITSALFASRYHLGNYTGAAEIGPTVIRLARDLEEWDVHGVSCVDLSATYLVTNRPMEAIRALNEYVNNFSSYGEGRRWETHVWFNFGYAYTRLGNHLEATKAFARARQVSTALGDHRSAQSARHALIEALLQVPDLGPVPRLLAESSAYLRKVPAVYEVEESRLFHLRLRAEHAIRTRRYKRARYIITMGLMGAGTKPLYQYEFHMLLAQLALELGDASEALGHALTARVHASQCGQQDRVAQASSFGYRLVQMYPGALHEFEQRLVT